MIRNALAFALVFVVAVVLVVCFMLGSVAAIHYGQSLTEAQLIAVIVVEVVAIAVLNLKKVA